MKYRIAKNLHEIGALRILVFFDKIIRHIASLRSEVLNERECVARFIFEKKHCKNGKFVPAAFEPSPKTPTEISVFRTTKLYNDDMGEIGNILGLLRGRKVKDIAKLLVSEIHSINSDGIGVSNFRVYAEPNIIHNNHANIKYLPLDEAKRSFVKLQLSVIANRNR